MILTSHHPIDKFGEWQQAPQGRPVSIGERVWIGARAVILPRRRSSIGRRHRRGRGRERSLSIAGDSLPGCRRVVSATSRHRPATDSGTVGFRSQVRLTIVAVGGPNAQSARAYIAQSSWVDLKIWAGAGFDPCSTRTESLVKPEALPRPAPTKDARLTQTRTPF